MLNATQLLRFCAERGGSDLHVSAGEPPRVRLNGELIAVDVPPLLPEEAHRIVMDVMNDAQRRAFQENLEVDFAYNLDESLRFRVNAFVHNRGEGAVFRTIPVRIPQFEDLGLPPAAQRFCEAEKGLVLVTGPTGSGKSTTLAAMLDYINEHEPGHILTLEDPVEFVHRSKRSLVNQREVGTQTRSFSAALRSALREDPDVILVGELRDLETIQLALTAAETGHLVFATLHTSSAAGTIDRIVDVFPPDQQAQVRTMLADSLTGVIAQMLVRRQQGGRAGVYEVLVGTPAVRTLIREGKTHQIPGTIQVSGRHGMQTMETAMMDLLSRRVVSLEEAQSRMPGCAALEAAAPQTRSA